MRYIFLFLFMVSVGFGHGFLETDGAAGDVLHLTGSCIGTLAIQKTFDLEWYEAGTFMFIAGCGWELGDEIFHRGIFDPAGASKMDFLRNLVGILISYPLKYDVKIGRDRIYLGIKL